MCNEVYIGFCESGATVLSMVMLKVHRNQYSSKLQVYNYFIVTTVALYGGQMCILHNAKVRQWIAMLRLWNKLIQIPDNCLTKKVFTWDYDLCQNWSSEVKEETAWDYRNSILYKQT